MKRGNQRYRQAVKKRRKNLAAVGFIVIVLCCTVGYNKLDLDSKNKEYKKRLAQLEEEKEAEENRTKEIEEYKAYVESKQFIEKEARDKLGLVYPDEIIFEPEEED